MYAVLFSAVTSFLVGFKYEITGRENVTQGPAVYIFNHQSIIDAITFGKYRLFDTVLVGKKEVIYIPFFGFIYWASGNILLNRADARASHRQVEKVIGIIKKRQVSIRVFPEGTRNKSHVDFLPFKRGAFLIASAAKVPIVPVVTSNYRNYFDTTNRHCPGGTIKIHFMKPIEIKSPDSEKLKEQIASIRSDMLKCYRELSGLETNV